MGGRGSGLGYLGGLGGEDEFSAAVGCYPMGRREAAARGRGGWRLRRLLCSVAPHGQLSWNTHTHQHTH